MSEKTAELRKVAATMFGTVFARAWVYKVRCEAYENGVLVIRASDKFIETALDNSVASRWLCFQTCASGGGLVLVLSGLASSGSQRDRSCCGVFR